MLKQGQLCALHGLEERECCIIIYDLFFSVTRLVKRMGRREGMRAGMATLFRKNVFGGECGIPSKQNVPVAGQLIAAYIVSQSEVQ